MVEAGNQAHERRLAGTGQTHERDHLTGPGLERDVVQHIGPFRVGKRHMVEGDVARYRRGVDRVGRIDGFRFAPEHGPDAPRAGHRSLQLARCVGDGGQGTVHGPEVVDDHQHAANRHLSPHDVHAAHDQDERRAEHDDHADDDREHRLLPRDGNPRLHGLAASFSITPGLVRFASKALHESNG